MISEMKRRVNQVKKIFDFGAYKEGLRITRSFGVITTVLLTLVSALSAIGEVLTSINNNEIGQREYVSLLGANPLLILMFCVIAPLMTVMAFRFTTSRAASDFYFSTPKTRTELYFSNIAAVFTWVLFSTIVSSVIPAVIYLAFTKYFVFKVLSSLLYLLTVLVSSFYIMAAVALAVSITGTVFSNIVTALLIIFAPRIFISAILSTSASSLTVADPMASFGLLSQSMNIPVNFVFTMGGLLFAGEVVTDNSLTAYLYTAILGTVYLLLGWALFKRRKSETAEKTAISDKMRAVIRIAIGAIVGLLLSVEFFVMQTHGVSVTDPLIVIATAAFAFIVYCSYELIATRSAKQMVKAMPGFFISLAVDLCALLLMLGVTYSVLSFTPSAADIDSVTISQTGDNGYYAAQTSKIKITDREIRNVISSSLKENVEYDRKVLSSNNNTDYSGWEDNRTEWSVIIKSAGTNHIRKIRVSESNNNLLLKALEKNADYKKIFTKLPSADAVETSVSFIGETAQLSAKDAKRIYKAYLEDISDGTVGFAEHYNTLIGYGATYGSSRVFSLQVDTVVGVDNYSITLPVYIKYNKAVTAYYSAVEKISVKNREKMLSDIKLSSGTDNMQMQLYGGVFNNGEYVDYTAVDSEKMYDIIKNAELTGIKADDPVLRLTKTNYNEENYQAEYCDIFVKLTKEQVEYFKKLAVE